jgi:hypothetical protein
MHKIDEVRLSRKRTGSSISLHYPKMRAPKEKKRAEIIFALLKIRAPKKKEKS